jgi:hypothetical protein
LAEPIGSIEDLQPDAKVIIRVTDTTSSSSVMSAVGTFIQAYKVTEKLFNSISILSERWLDLSLE